MQKQTAKQPSKGGKPGAIRDFRFCVSRSLHRLPDVMLITTISD